MESREPYVRHTHDEQTVDEWKAASEIWTKIARNITLIIYIVL